MRQVSDADLRKGQERELHRRSEQRRPAIVRRQPVVAVRAEQEHCMGGIQESKRENPVNNYFTR